MNWRPLVTRQLLPERLAAQQAAGVERFGGAPLGDADPAHRVREPPAGEPLLGDDEALALAAEQVAERHGARRTARSPGARRASASPSTPGGRTIRQPGVVGGDEDEAE